MLTRLNLHSNSRISQFVLNTSHHTPRFLIESFIYKQLVAQRVTTNTPVVTILHKYITHLITPTLLLLSRERILLPDETHIRHPRAQKNDECEAPRLVARAGMHLACTTLRSARVVKL